MIYEKIKIILFRNSVEHVDMHRITTSRRSHVVQTLQVQTCSCNKNNKKQFLINKQTIQKQKPTTKDNQQNTKITWKNQENNSKKTNNNNKQQNKKLYKYSIKKAITQK